MSNQFHVRVTEKSASGMAISYMLEDRFFHDQNDALNAVTEVFETDDEVLMVEIFKSGVPASVVMLER